MRRRTVLFAAAMLATASGALAAQAERQPRVELQPFIGYRLGGTFNLDDSEDERLDIDSAMSYGLTVGIAVGPSGQMDLLWSHQETDLDVDGSIPGVVSRLSGFTVDYYQIEGSYVAGAIDDKVRPFAAFGMGATRYGAPDGFSGNQTQFAVSIGGGAKVILGKSVGMRFQGRWIPTFFDTDEAIFCTSGSGCIATASGDIVAQIEITTGLVLRF